MLTATVSVALALVFVLVLCFVSDQALTRRYSELRNCVNRVAHEYTGQASLDEEQEDYPGIELFVFSPDGTRVASTSKYAPSMSIGAHQIGDQLTFGSSSGSKTFVAMSSWVETKQGLQQITVVLALLWLPLTLLTAGAAWYGGGLVLRPVTELVTSAERISGSDDAIVLTTTDTAEFAELATSLNQLIARVRHASLLQEQFASDAAHELRNPLAILRMRIEANLMRERTPDEHVASQAKMLCQLERLTATVEALLRSARQASPGSDMIDPGDAVVAASTDWAELTGWPAERLKIEVASCNAKIDPDEVAIILRNLLDNAARHAPTGTPIEIQVVETGGSVRLSVLDFGPGISAKDADKIFERFYRSDEARDRRHGGAGIGLAIVKRVAESHGGTARLEVTDIGTRITVELPVP